MRHIFNINIAESFQSGVLFPKFAVSKLLNGKTDEGFERIRLKRGILNYIRKNDEVHLSDLLEIFNAENPSTIIELVQELKSQKSIRSTD